jgi:hypothetical protein
VRQKVLASITFTTMTSTVLMEYQNVEPFVLEFGGNFEENLKSVLIFKAYAMKNNFFVIFYTPFLLERV